MRLGRKREGAVAGKLLITGAAGQLGQALVQAGARQGWEVVATDLPELNITDPQLVQGELSRQRPEVVINAAAATRVDDLESDPDGALRVNALGPRNLAVACRRLGIKLIHLSTDYVFDGTKPGPYVEWDATSPLSVYGRSKLLGEEWVRQQCPDHFIVRTAWLYGMPGPNFVTAILARGRHLAPDGELKVVDDQRGTPTSALALAPQLLALAATEAFGTYHATCQGETTWFEFAGLILKTAGITVRVTPCTTAEFPRPAPRPANSVLENRLLKVAGLDLHARLAGSLPAVLGSIWGPTMSWVLVTGGAGFIGANFLYCLRRQQPEAHIINLDLLTYAGNPENLVGFEGDARYILVRGDVADRELVQDLFSRYPITKVVHFAAESHVDRSILDPGVFVRTNVVGTFTLLEAARQAWKDRAGPEAPRFLHVSTDEVYGSLGPDDPPVTETAPVRPPESVRRVQGQRRLSGAGLFSHLPVAGAHHQLFQQLRPLPVSGKADPFQPQPGPGR